MRPRFFARRCANRRLRPALCPAIPTPLLARLRTVSHCFAPQLPGKLLGVRIQCSRRRFTLRPVYSRQSAHRLGVNLGNVLPRLALPRSVKNGSLTTLREKFIQIGAKVVAHCRTAIFQMAEGAVPRWLFRCVRMEGEYRAFGARAPLVRYGEWDRIGGH